MKRSLCRYTSLVFSALIVMLFSAVSPSMAKECLDCHASNIGGRGNIATQMTGGSHHVQGVKLNGRHCYACHWEATPEGKVDERYHAREAGQNTPKVNAPVELVIWASGQRPTLYKPYSTAVTFQSAAIGTAQERQEVGKISRHCLGCHSDNNNDTPTFEGDIRTPRQYAWDGESIASRYGQQGVVTWGKYSTSASNKKKQVVKALSAHGNAAANKGGWSTTSGYDGNIPISRGGAGAGNVECFDCHNSHGSVAAETTSSYRSFNGTLNGGLLKETVSGKGGYAMSYKPSVNTNGKSRNPFNAGAGICFDCHETATAGITPWGYSSTFGASEPIMGYKDTLRFDNGKKGSTSRFAQRKSHTEIISSHFKAGSFLNYSANEQINGLCSSCHDPHGISKTLGEKMSYAVPLLKGTWLTSPYREDGPPNTSPGKGGFAKDDGGGNRAIAWEKGDFSFTNREANANFGIGGGGAPREPMSMVGMKYNIDRNTFGGSNRISETDDTFAGICLKCHSKDKFTGESKTALIHRAVKGWGRNKEHSFPCSKCHQPHNSGLPRLMQTNCFQEGPSGLRESSGLLWLPVKKGEAAQAPDDKTTTSKSNSTAKKVELVGCHVRQFGKGSSKKTHEQGDNQWKEKTAW